MTNPIISVRNLSKKYTLGERQLYYSFRDSISNLFKTPFTKEKLQKDQFWALKDISFDVNEGDVIGIIGRNGAGKSTLLKILSRITPPTTGEIILRGRVGSLLEVGTGFHQELTGRENIFLNGAILGMTRSEVKSKFKAIVDFAEIEKFMDTPVKHYSSGMYMRLAFAVAAHLEPEILLVDEVLAVGDAQFQKKCLGKLSEVSKKGRTILFVSHNMQAISALCKNTILLKEGKVEDFGLTKDVIANYLNKELVTSLKLEYKYNKASNQIEKVSIENIGDSNSLDFTKPVIFNVRIRNIGSKNSFYLGIEILNSYNEPIIFGRDIEICPELRKDRNKKIYNYQITIPGKSLTPGKYLIRLTLVDLMTKEVYDAPNKNLSFEITDFEGKLSQNGLAWRGLTSIPLTVKY